MLFINPPKKKLNSQVKVIYYKDGYPDELASEMLAEAGIPLVHLRE